MMSPRLKSSVVATVAGTGFVLAAFAAGSVSQMQDQAAVKGDLLEVPMKVSCTADCNTADERIARAFDTFAEHDADAGVTVLSRVPAQ
ncbi:MAG: hypothetical protein AAGJ94_00905 [Pseudomonadota bacterium]